MILTNAEFSDAVSELAERLQVFVGIPPPASSGSKTHVLTSPPNNLQKENGVEARAHRLLLGLAKGQVDRTDLAPDASDTFTVTAVEDIQQSLATLGTLERVRLDSTQMRGGTKHYALTLIYAYRKLQVAEYDLSDGKIEQFLIDDKP